jgi:hypothetical protein
MDSFKTKVMQGKGFWTLEVRTPEGLCLYYRYDNLPQARYFAAVFELGPPSFPTPFKTYFRAQKRGRKSRGEPTFAKSA